MKWIEFVKDFAKKNNIKYGEALKKAKDDWAKHKESSPQHQANKSKPTKPKKKAKKSKGIKMTIKEKEKKKNVDFA